MRAFKALFDFYIQASIHVASAILCLVLITFETLSLLPDFMLTIQVFFGTLVGYNFLKYFEAFRKGAFTFEDKKWLVGITLFSGIGFVYFFIQNSSFQQIEFLKISLIVVVYPFLRKYGFLKLFLVSFCVSYCTVYLPSVAQVSISKSIFLLFLQRFLIVISLLIPFEILDSQTDDDSMKTLPQRFGIFKTKLFGIVLLLPFVLLEFLKEKIEIAAFIIAIITALFIRFTTLKREKYYTSFWVESVPILWWLILVYT